MKPEDTIPLKNVITYARAVTGCAASLENQRERMKSHCEGRELTVVKHVEETGSRSELSRPGIHAIMKAVNDDIEVQAVVVDGLDRISRSMVQCISFQRFLERKGLKLIDISGRPEAPDLAMTKAFWEFFREAEHEVNEAPRDAADSGIDNAEAVDTVE